MANWSHIQSRSTNFGAVSTAQTLAYSSNVAKGDLLLVWIRHNTPSVTVTITDSQGNVWSEIGPVTNGTNLKMALWWAIANASGANTITATPSGSSNISIGIQEYNCAQTGIATDGTANASGSSTTPAPGSVTAAGGDDLALCGVGTGSGTATAGTGYTLRVTQTTVPLYVEDAFDVSTTQTPTMTTANGVWLALGATFKFGAITSYPSFIGGGISAGGILGG